MPITLKRKAPEADSAPPPRPTAIPSTLPPSVEEAYRRKCVQLKNRTNEVEDANDAARLRLARIKRQVEKLRIERAFLLEQLAKRTSANVEDSDGSPSPPPTVRFLPLHLPSHTTSSPEMLHITQNFSIPFSTRRVSLLHEPFLAPFDH